MYLYLTNGSYEYLKQIKQKFPDEMMVIMENEEDALLLHETESESVFKVPRKYEILDSLGSFPGKGLVVMNHIPVTDEGRSLFEYRFKHRSRQVEDMPGFLAIRVLRPLSANPYIIMTVWANETAFEDWKNSTSFNKAHHGGQGESGAGSRPKIFAGNGYVTKYTISEEEESKRG